MVLVGVENRAVGDQICPLSSSAVLVPCSMVVIAISRDTLLLMPKQCSKSMSYCDFFVS